MTRTPIAVAVVAAVAASAFAGEAHAQAVTATVAAPAPATVGVGESTVNRPGFSVAGLLGLAFAADGVGALFDFGARGGYTLPMHLYVGGDLGYAVASFGIFHLQGEVGYELAIPSVPSLLIRPYGGIGFTYVKAGGGGNTCVAGDPICVNVGGGGSSATFLFSPGGVVEYFVTPNVFVGGDVRIPIYLGGYSTVGFDLLATGGYKF